MQRTPEQRFWAKVRPGANGCQEWHGARNGRGYGSFMLDGRVLGAHRVAYILAHGYVPPGLVLDHLCRNTLCVRVDHLQAVTQRENVARGVGNASRLCCPQGHPYSESNTVRRNGRRFCRLCERMHGARSRAKKRAQREQERVA